MVAESRTNDVLIMKTSYAHFLTKKHQVDHVIGLRSFGRNFGMGFNFGHSVSNQIGLWSNTFSPGFELFYKQLQFSGNLYLPYRQIAGNRKLNVFNPTIGDFGITYKPVDKFEFGVIPFYNFSQRKWGLNSNLSVFISNSIELQGQSFWRGADKSISIAIKFHFGGPKDRSNQEIRKLNVFKYAQKKTLKKAPEPAFIPVITIAAPVTLPELPKVQPVEVSEPAVALPPNDEPKPSWLGGFFFRGRDS